MTELITVNFSLDNSYIIVGCLSFLSGMLFLSTIINIPDKNKENIQEESKKIKFKRMHYNCNNCKDEGRVLDVDGTIECFCRKRK